MCQQIIQFCSSSTKPLLWAGSFLMLLLAIAIGYIACSSNALYQDIDSFVAQEKSLGYYLQLIAAGYLFLLTGLSCFAAYYDQKYIIRALAVITAINFALTVAAILMNPSSTEVASIFAQRLKEAQKDYNFTDRYPVPVNKSIEGQQQGPDTGLNRSVRMASEGNGSSIGGSATQPGQTTSAPVISASKPREPLTPIEATKIWDKLQERGCCGLYNATEEWKEGLPKSCCAKPQEDANNKITCKLPLESDHSQPCAVVIGSTSTHLLALLALIALANLYLAIITGVSTYRTFHYNEASQSAY